MKERFLTLIASFLLCVGIATAQNITVQGVVTSAEDNEPVVGATVVVKGTNLGAATDIDGKFLINNVPANSTIQISYVGMDTKEVPATTKEMNIVLESNSTKLDEVMVVAFGQVKKSAFTGSATVIDSKQLDAHITSNVTNALVGTVPGLQMRGNSGAPGSSGTGNINVRGISSMEADTDPLVIVDGAPYPTSLSEISPSDIESVTVLKDAASAALYGARGAAGVIIVTTKKGKSKVAKISVDARWGANTRAVPQYDVITDPAAYYEAYYSQIYNRNFYGRGMSAADANANANSLMLENLGYNVYTYPDGEKLIGLDGKINPNATLGRVYDAPNGQAYYLTPDNWEDLAYRTALRQEYNVSLNGAGEKSSYYASIGYLDEDGVIYNSAYDRLTARFRADYQARKWLKFGVNAGYVHSNTTSNPNLSSTSTGATNILYYTNMIAPIYPAFIRGYANGAPYIMTDERGQNMYDYGTPVVNGYYGLNRGFLANGNPLGANLYNKVTNINDQLNATFNVDVNFTEWLKLNVTSTVNYTVGQLSNYENPFFGPTAANNGALTKSNSTSMRTNNVQTLTFNKSFGLHNVNALIGHEYYKVTSRFLMGHGYGSFSPEIPELNAFATKDKAESYKTGYNVEGYFLSAQYDYNNKYFGSFSYRRDASSRFAKEHRWGNFWSVGGAWMISSEDFMYPTNGWLDQLKLKASIGQQGNDNIGNWAYVDLYSISSSSSTTMSPTFARIGNPTITWETTTNFNVGLEFIMFRGRLSGNIDVYNKKTTDLLFWLQLPESIGTRGYYGNIGDIQNTGVEVSLNGTLIQEKNFDWKLNLNFSHNTTKILKLPKSKTEINGGFTDTFSQQGISFWYEEGQPMYNAFVPEYAGPNEFGEATYWCDASLLQEGGTMNTSKPGKNHDYVTTNINNATHYAKGSVLPKLFGGFGTTVRIYDFDLSANFDYQIGGKMYDFQYAALMSPSTGKSGSNIHVDYIKSWSPNNTSSNIPRWQYGDQYTTARQDRFLTNAGYLNFSAFSVGYTVPSKWVGKYFDKIRVYAIGENLCFWSARKGFDPRNSFSENTMVGSYSPVRNISGGVQLTF